MIYPQPATIGRQLSSLLSVTQQEFFQSVQDNVGDTGGAGKMLALAFAAGAIVILLAVLSKRKKKESVPRAVNHRGRLLKEISRTVGLKRSEMRKLKAMADAQEIANPMTLLLCPSLLAKSLKKRT